MSDLPAPDPHCPDCKVPIGTMHHIDCLTAICVLTGQQRVLHAEEPPPTPAGIDLANLGVDGHFCGHDVWSGHRHGVIEAVAYGLFVREAGPADAPLTGWIPCEPGQPGAVPDLDRLARTGQWNPTRQVWELPCAVAGRG